MNIKTYHGPIMKKTNHHVYIAPDPELSDMIAHYTITYVSGEALSCDHYHILPDASGCFIFQGERIDFWGPMSEMVVLKNDLEEASERLFVEFRPGGLYQVSGYNQKELSNQRDAIQTFDPILAQQLKTLLHACSTYDEAITNLNAWFLRQRKKHVIPSDFMHILKEIDQAFGDIQIDTLANQYARSSRQLLREFHRYIGMSAKRYANIVRFNQLVQELQKNEGMIQTAMANGFFDQSHFNKMFKQITHLSPSNYIENLTDFYRELYKF